MILCCGEALIDMLPRKTETGAQCFQPFPGGSVFNTAVTLGRLDIPAGLFTGLSDDLFGTQLAQHLTQSHVDYSLSARSSRPTTLAFVTLTDGQARYAFYDENTAGRMLEPADLPTLPDHITGLFFGGISLMVEPAAQAYEALMLREAPTRPVMLDPNIRPTFIADAPIYRARLERMVAAASVVKVSDEDLHWVMGDGPLDELATALREKGPAILFVTQGAEGVRVFSGEAPFTIPATRVEVKDTVGAGDTFNGAFLAALYRDGLFSKNALAAMSTEALSDAVAYATRAAAVTVSREGADPPWTRDLT